MDRSYQVDHPVWFTPEPTKYAREMWKSSPTPPPPQPVPDPTKEISAQAKATPSAYTPYGSRVYSGSPNDGTFAYTETLGPAEQQQKDLRDQVTLSLMGRAQNQIPNIPADPFDYGNFQFDPNDPVTNQTWEAQKGLLDPYFAREETRLDQKLANQGIPMGAEAYRDEVDQFRKTKASSYDQAAANALDRGFSQAKTTYDTNYQTGLGTRQQNYNELAALLGGQQLNNINYNPGTMVDPSSAYARSQSVQNANYQNRIGQYNAGVASNNNMMSGLFGLGSAAIMASDVRLKTDIEYVGTHHGIPWYTYRYIWDTVRRIGVMAQEVLRVRPEAVSSYNGWLRVDYGMLS